MTTTTLTHLDPKALAAHPANVRSHLGDLAELTASIRHLGVLEPIVVVAADDGHRIIAGHRRTAAAIEAGLDTVPCCIRDDLADDSDQLVGMLAENLRRADLTDIEEARGYQALLDLGLSATKIAKATGTARTRVRQALDVTKSADATGAAAEHNLTLDQAAVLAEFDGDEDALATLHRTLKDEPEYLDHEASALRQARERRQERDRTIQEQRDAAVAILDDEPIGWGTDALDRPRRLTHLVDGDGQDLDPDQHTTCPGHAVWITPLDWWQIEVVAACTNPAEHGHRNRFTNRGHDSGTPAKDPEEAKAERREVIANNKAWRAAEPVRRDHIRSLLARTKVPKGTLRYVVDEIMTDPASIGHPDDAFLAELTGTATPDGAYSWEHPAGRQLAAKAPDSRLPLVLLAQVAAAREQSMGVHTWRRANPTTEARWLNYLVSTGYQPSTIEQHVIDTAAAVADPDDDDHGNPDDTSA